MPYAVFDTLAPMSDDDVEELVVKELGPSYRLGGVMDLQQLGLGEWPRTRNAKVSIADVRRAVIDYVASKAAKM